jgi:hypothetical protein
MNNQNQTIPPAPAQVAEITEAQVIAFCKAHCERLLKKYPQVERAGVQLGFSLSPSGDNYRTANVHLKGATFHECGIQDTLAASEEQAARPIETPEKILLKARRGSPRSR